MNDERERESAKARESESESERERERAVEREVFVFRLGLGSVVYENWRRISGGSSYAWLRMGWRYNLIMKKRKKGGGFLVEFLALGPMFLTITSQLHACLVACSSMPMLIGC